MTTGSHWTPSPGEKVAGRYEIQGEFGAGGIAEVWEGYDTQQSRTVAVKHILFDSRNFRESPATIRSLFEREVETLKKIRDAGGHPNIIDLYDIVSYNNTKLVIVEPVAGRELDHQDVSVSSDEAREIAIELASAMGFLHKNEIIYRDLKPDNAMLRSDGSPILIDFNTAKQIENDRRAGQFCPSCGTGVELHEKVCPDCGETFEAGNETQIGAGTNSPYKPPETTEARAHVRQGPWSDVYSLGKILHFLIDDYSTGVPVASKSGPQDFGVDCPNYMDEIIRRSTRRNTDDRYSNAEVFKLVLENRDPDPPAKATLKRLETDNIWEIAPGDTVGRKGAAGPDATIALSKSDDYISAVQVQFRLNDDNNWVLHDQSLNGTYIQRGGGWQRILCAQGRQRLKQKGQDHTDRHGNVPPEQTELGREAVIALVNPQYDITFEFKKQI